MFDHVDFPNEGRDDRGTQSIINAGVRIQAVEGIAELPRAVGQREQDPGVLLLGEELGEARSLARVEALRQRLVERSLGARIEAANTSSGSVTARLRIGRGA